AASIAPQRPRGNWTKGQCAGGVRTLVATRPRLAVAWRKAGDGVGTFAALPYGRRQAAAKRLSAITFGSATSAQRSDRPDRPRIRKELTWHAAVGRTRPPRPLRRSGSTSPCVGTCPGRF